MAIIVTLPKPQFVNVSQQMDGCTWTRESDKQTIITQCAGYDRAMPRGLHGLREGRAGKRAKARVSVEMASWKMAVEWGLEQSSMYGLGKVLEADRNG